MGRVKTYEAIVKGENIPEPGIPESFKVLIKEMQSLALDIKVLSDKNEEIEIRESIDDELETHKVAEIEKLADADVIYNEDEGGYLETDETGEPIEYDDYEDDDEEDDISDEEFSQDDGLDELDYIDEEEFFDDEEESADFE